MASCNRPIRFKMSVVEGSEVEVIMEVCSEEVDETGLSDSDLPAYPPPTASQDKTSELRRQRRSVLETRGLETVNLQIIKSTAGAELNKGDIDMLMGAVGDDFGAGNSPHSPTSVQIWSPQANMTMGIYAGEAIDPTSLVGAIRGFGSQNIEGASMIAAQRCGPDVPENRSFGFVFDATSNSKQAADEMMNLWHTGRCVTDFESEEAWNNVIINIRE